MSTRKQRKRRLAFAQYAKETETERGSEKDALEEMTKEQLIQYAKDNSIQVNSKAKKAEILQIIRDKVIA